jgi:adenylate cyclase class IV
VARNIEIKARLRDRPAVERAARLLAHAGPFRLLQDDTFFVSHEGRLKLRVQAQDGGPDEACLIFYQRPDAAGPKTSFYRMTATADPDGLRDTLTLAHGVLGRVRKARTLYLAGPTRIHLDEVEQLGDFLELEVVLTEVDAPHDVSRETPPGVARDAASEAAGIAEAERLMAALGILPEDLVETAYLDLLAARSPATDRKNWP